MSDLIERLLNPQRIFSHISVSAESELDVEQCEQDMREAAAALARLTEQCERMRGALRKIAGLVEYDKSDYDAAVRYKREQGMWTVDEYLADVTLGDQQITEKSR